MKIGLVPSLFANKFYVLLFLGPGSLNTSMKVFSNNGKMEFS